MKTKFTWKEFGYKENPEVVGEFLQSIEKRHKRLDASLIVEGARDPGSPIHDMFEWDDTEAAEKYREIQARRILCSLDVFTGPVKTMRAYVNIRKTNGSVDSFYRDTQKALNNPEDLKYLLSRAKSELMTYVKKYQDYKQFASVTDELQLVLENFPTVEGVLQEV